MKLPSENEYAEYYQRYTSQVEGDVFETLERQYEEMLELFSSLNEEKGAYAYAEGKWSVKELLGHVIDAERVFAYRAMCIARGEKQELPGFEQDGFVTEAKFNNRSLSSLQEEYKNLRLSDIALFKSFSEEDLNKTGIASNNPVSVRALIFIAAGHERHHINILKEKYKV